MSILVKTIGFVVGRNGIHDIREIAAWKGSAIQDNKEIELCYLDFYSKRRGQLLNAGGAISAEAMDELATEWLKSRGKFPQ